ncbi:MAG: serine hydrolase [Bacteroidota bacterium]|nr:serine hydrolase [Flavisolibacter sp.]MDQ3844753.1 serine hydrolase [Bacteroidota bacterium]
MKKVLTFIFTLFICTGAVAQAMQQKTYQFVQQEMDELLKAYVKENRFNGAVLVAQKGNILFEKGYGYRDAEQRTSHTAQDVFQIGSITKQITAAVIMQLQEEGKLSVQDKLNKYFPDFPNADKITLEHLLTHTSGIYNYTNDAVILKQDVTRSYSQQELLDKFKSYPSDFEPGTKWNYSNTAYSLLGYIIEKVTNKPYERVVRERIFLPLGMTNSGFDFTHLAGNKKSKGYFSLTGDKGVPAPIVDSTIAFSAGAVYSNVEDLYKWERAIYTNKILKPSDWDAVFTPYKNNYGYGWTIDTLYNRTYMAHSGGIHGFTSFLMRFPKDEVVVIMLDNSSSSQLSKISKNLAAIALDQPFEFPRERKEVKLDNNVLQQYVGEYELAPGFIITVTLQNNALKAQATNQPPFDLFAERENFFFLKAVDAQVEFIKDETGKVTEMVLYQNGMHPRGKRIK